jgi:hypothetical protein
MWLLKTFSSKGGLEAVSKTGKETWVKSAAEEHDSATPKVIG